MAVKVRPRPVEAQETHIDHLTRIVAEAKREEGEALPKMTRKEAHAFFFKR